MHIQRITVQNFRCFEHLEFELNPDINIFVGNNGSGKSAVLDAIAAAMYPYVAQVQEISGKKIELLPVFKKDLPVQKKGNQQKIQPELTVIAKDLPKWKILCKYLQENSSSKMFMGEVAQYKQNGTKKLFSALEDKFSKNYNSSCELSIIAYYRSERNLTKIDEVATIFNHSFDRFDALNNSFDGTSNFTDLVNWFFAREFQELREVRNRGDMNYELPDLQQVRNAIKTIIHPNARVYSNQTTSIQLMVEWTTETGEKLELSINQLSAGYRNMLALVMDFARRLAQANPHLETPLEAEAILMIDEIDLHLHPTWQQKIIPDLRKVFPNTQIIATTHSPEVVTTVDRHQVWILEDYQIKACPTPTKGMKSSDIVRYVLGLGDLRPDTEESRKLKALFAAIDAGNLEEAKRLQKELEVWEFFDADMTRANMQIRRLERSSPV
ncbi:MAG: AAA family ATPase [Snowella sp.]|nr:AAA family ATPase [Snowella sp.]